ncbi:MAG: hypothetical protein PHY47_01275 [Lachnospiraceae bacterium]|nr:hypothetical protein [Lachnospiraceae bacterium]
MTTYTIEDIKRLKICPILFKNKWDYSDHLIGLNPTYLYGIKEVFRWYYRRGSQITPDAITTSISFNALQNRLDFTSKTELETAFRHFVDGATYKNMSQPHYNKEISMNLNEDILLTHVSPVVYKDNKKLAFLSYDLGMVTSDYFLNQYETMFEAVWSFYVLDMMPVFLNLYLENESIKEQHFKPNMDYIKHSKEKLIQIGRGMGYNKAPPPPELCLHCQRSNECPTINVEKLLRK